LRTDHPEWRHLALADAGRELDEHVAPVIERPQGPPGRIIALNAVTEVERIDIDAGRDGRGRIGGGVLLS
jgi:hypothetical protein